MRLKVWGVFRLVVVWVLEFGRGRDKHFSWVVVVDEWYQGMNGWGVSVLQSLWVEYRAW